MQSTIDTFNERTAEIELYFDALEKLYIAKEEDDSSERFFEDDFLKILKSNALLMIYNLVESTILGGIVEIYDVLKQNGINYRQVRREIQDIWFSYKFNQVYDKNAHYNSYREKAAEIITSILEDRPLVLGRKATQISGNLDAEMIRQVCTEHGIIYHVDPGCRGGFALTDVKEKRNNLAHGTSSFVECGRNYTITDLKKTKDETILFLSGILNGMQDYYSQQLYLQQA